MKLNIKSLWICNIFSILFLISACSEEEGDKVEAPGTLDATVSATAILVGESVIFSDLSTKVKSRHWEFADGTPETSTEPNVEVMYATAGTKNVRLTVVYSNNSVVAKDFSIQVTAPAPPIEKFGIFTEGIVSSSVDVTFQPNNQFVIADEASAFEGTTAKSFTIAGTSDWAMASIKPAAGSVDVSAYATGYYNIAIKSTSNGTILFRIQSNAGANKAILTFTAVGEQYGFKRDGEWHKLKIPVADLKAANANLDLSAISDLLVLRSDGDVRTANNYNFYIDDFYLTKE